MRSRFLIAAVLMLVLGPDLGAQAQSPVYNRRETPASQREDAQRAQQAARQKAQQDKLEQERLQREEASRQKQQQEQSARQEALRLQQAQQAAAQQKAALYAAPGGMTAPGGYAPRPGDENLPINNYALQYPNAGQNLNIDVNAMSAPCTPADVKQLGKLEQKIAIFEPENQRGMGEREFQSGFKQALDVFNDPAFLSEYTTLTARCANGVTASAPATSPPKKSRR